MTRNPLTRLAQEAARAAAVQGLDAAAVTQANASSESGQTAGTDVSGTWQAFGLLDITTLTTFRLSSD